MVTREVLNYCFVEINAYSLRMVCFYEKKNSSKLNVIENTYTGCRVKLRVVL